MIGRKSSIFITVKDVFLICLLQWRSGTMWRDTLVRVISIHASYPPGSALRTEKACDLKVALGKQVFFFKRPVVNQLPPSVREADTVTSFKSRLNTFLFDRAYSEGWIRFALVQPLDILLKAFIGCWGTFRIHWAPLSSSLSTYGWIFISLLHITNSAFSPESFWLHVS